MNHPLAPVHARPLAGLLLASAAALSLAGCGEDPAVSGATAYGDRFAQLAEDYRKLSQARSLITETGPAENTSDLAGILGGLQQLSGGTPEQAAAAALLKAKVADDLGAFEAARAARAEASSIRVLELAAAIGEAAYRVEVLSSTEVSFAAERERLAAMRSAANGEVEAARAEVSAMKGPIERLAADRERRLAEIAALDAEVARLQRDASIAGASAGFPLAEEAATMKSQAIRLRTRSALELGQLESATSDLVRTESALVAGESVASAAQAGMAELEDFATLLDRDATAGKELATRLRSEAETLLTKAEALRGESLDALYQSATNSFTEAAAAADSADSVAKDSAQQYRLGALRARGSMLQSRVAGLDAEAAVLARLAAAGPLFGGAAKAKPALEAIAARRATLVEDAKTAYGEAMALIESMGSEQPAVARTKAAMEASLAMLEGKESPARPMDAGTGAPAAAASAPTGGFATPKELVDFLNSIDRNSFRGGLQAFGVMHASDRAAKAFLDSARSMLDAIAPFATAAEKAYGAESLANAMTNGMGGMGGMGGGAMLASFDGLSLASEDGESARMTNSRGDTVPLVKVGGSWFVDANELAASMGGGQGQAMAAAGPMMAMMKPAMTEAALAVAGRIEAGEFADAGAAVAAFNEAMKAAIAKSMGGFGGGGGGFGGGQQ